MRPDGNQAIRLTPPSHSPANDVTDLEFHLEHHKEHVRYNYIRLSTGGTSRTKRPLPALPGGPGEAPRPGVGSLAFPC